MPRKEIGTAWNRDSRNSMNDNFVELYQETKNAHDAVDGFLNSQFDDGVLRTKIDEKLNDLEQEYAPQLNEVTAQLAQTETQTNANKIKIVDASKKISSPSYDSNNSLFAIVFDDCRVEDLTIVKPILDARGIKATFACITDRVGESGYMTKEQLLQLQSEGHEIVSHSTNHQRIYTDDTTPDEEIEASLRDSQKWLIENGFTGYDTFIVPYGSVNERSKKLISKYYNYSLLSHGGAVTEFPFDNLKIPRKGIRANEDFQTELRPVIDESRWNDGLLVFLVHSWIPEETNETYLKQAIDYVLGQGERILTLRESLKYKGNALSIGDFESDNKLFISNDGNIVGQNLNIDRNLITGASSKTMDDPLSTYPKWRETVVMLNQSKDTFKGQGGIMRVLRLDDYYSYATFKPSQENIIYVRKWNVGQNAWDSWGN